jgi:Raf kinase inhibitor-like YbhB/YbcL family protein
MLLRGWTALFLFLLASCAAAPTQPTRPGTTPPAAGAAATIRLTSPAFSDGQPVPVEYTCSGSNHSPELKWEGLPAGTHSLTLLVLDPDAPSGTYTHWVLANLPATLTGLAAGQPTPAGAIDGTNSSSRAGYTGPCPPAGKVHHYIFTLYAVDQVLQLDAAPNRAALEAALQGHVLATGQLTGTFQR